MQILNPFKRDRIFVEIPEKAKRLPDVGKLAR
jgi:hypothetical protein